MVETFSSYDITSTTAVLSGSMRHLGKDPISEWGIIWSANAGISATNGAKGIVPLPATETFFSFLLADLTPATTYYFKAYAIAGGTVHYGGEQSFTTITPGEVSLKPLEAFTGDTITLFGENFNVDKDKIGVLFDTTKATIVAANKTSISVIVPKRIANDKPIVYLSLGGEIYPSKEPFTLKYWKQSVKIPYVRFKEYGNMFNIQNRVFGIISGSVYEFDLITKTWIPKKKPILTGTDGALYSGRTDGTVFSIGNKAYLVFGGVVNEDSKYPLASKDFFEYDAIEDKWTKKADFPGRARSETVAFVVNNKGYITTGLTVNGRANVLLKDTWQFDPATDQWIQLSDFPGGERRGAMVMIDKQDVYMGFGYNGLTHLNDFWKLNAVDGTWTELEPLPAAGRCYAQAFSIDNYGYVVGGSDFVEIFKKQTYLRDFYKFDFVRGKWSKLGTNPDQFLSANFAFNGNEKRYVGLDLSIQYSDYDYLYEFIPNE